MFTREEKSALRQKFWTAFGKYMSPVPSASGEKVHWINYKSGIKGIGIRTDADDRTACVKLEISHRNPELQEGHANILRTLFRDMPPAGFTLHQTADTISISAEKSGVNIFRESDWPEIITFLKSQLTLLDGFWVETKDLFN